MLNNVGDFIKDAVYWIPALIIALSFHEFAHGFVADRLGDPTPRQQGRLTLNPLKHVDPIGLLMLVLVRFGWAKPVQVNPLYFKGDRRMGMLKVALAGPVTNFILALVAGLGGGLSILLINRGAVFAIHLFWFFSYLLIYNIYFGVFNLLPIPPLDGSKILFNILPPKYTQFMYQIQRYGFLILMLFLFTGLHRYFLTPVASFLINAVWAISAALISLF